MTVTMMDSNVSERGFVVVDRNGDGPRLLNEDCVINDRIPMQSMSTNGQEAQQDHPRPHLQSFNVPDNEAYMRWSISSFMRFTGLLTCPQVYCFALLVSRHYLSFMNTILSNAAPANNTSCPTAASRSNPPSHHLLELKNEVLRKHRMALYFASSTLCVNILIVQNSSSNVPKVLGILTIITCLDVACQAVAIGRFVNLMAIENNSHILYHWGASDVHTAALVFAIPEASVLGCIVSVGTCIVLYLTQPNLPLLQLSPSDHGMIEPYGAMKARANLVTTTHLSLPPWAIAVTIIFATLLVIQFVLVLCSLSHLSRTRHGGADIERALTLADNGKTRIL